MLVSSRATNILLVLLLAVGIGIVAMLATGARGGPLDPPGPPAATLPQVEPRTPISSLPYTISSPGSYYLTRNLAMGTDTTGITISVEDVAIDLNGFTLSNDSQGDCVPAPNAIGITTSGGPLVVHNGTIRGWQTGLDGGLRIDDLTILCNNIGVVAGDGSTVSNLQVVRNFDVGIYATGQGARIENNNVSANLNGVLVAALVGAGNMIRSNTVTNNGTGIRVDGAENVVVQNLLEDIGIDINLVSSTNYAPVESPPMVTRSVGEHRLLRKWRTCGGTRTNDGDKRIGAEQRESTRPASVMWITGSRCTTP